MSKSTKKNASTNAVRNAVSSRVRENGIDKAVQSGAVYTFIARRKNGATMNDIIEFMQKAGSTSRSFYDICNGLKDAGKIRKSDSRPVTFFATAPKAKAAKAVTEPTSQPAEEAVEEAPVAEMTSEEVSA